MAVDTAGGDAALVLERTLGNRLTTAGGAFGWQTAPTVRDLISPTIWHAPEVLESPNGAVLISDLRERRNEPPIFAANGFRSVAAVLIGHGSRPYGVLAVYARRPDAFNFDVLPLLSTLAVILGLAVRHAHLTADLDRGRDDRFRLASLVEGSDDAIVSATLDGTIISWNPGAERLYGYPAHEIVGQDVSMLVPALMPLHMTHIHGPAGHGHPSVGADSLWISIAAIGVHTLAMLLVTGLVAVITYEWLGLGFLRRGWINFDVLWTIVLLATGLLVLLVH